VAEEWAAAAVEQAVEWAVAAGVGPWAVVAAEIAAAASAPVDSVFVPGAAARRLTKEARNARI